MLCAAKVETVAFFGDPGNLDSALRDPAWQKMLRDELGLRFEVAHRRPVARLCGCRLRRGRARFDGRHAFTSLPRSSTTRGLRGFPFIGGPDSAYEAEGEEALSENPALSTNGRTPFAFMNPTLRFVGRLPPKAHDAHQPTRTRPSPKAGSRFARDDLPPARSGVEGNPAWRRSLHFATQSAAYFVENKLGRFRGD